LVILILSFSRCSEVAELPEMDKSEITRLDSIAQAFHDEGLRLQNLFMWEEAIPKYDSALYLRDSLSLHLKKVEKLVAENILQGIIRSLQNKSNCYYYGLQAWDSAEKTLQASVTKQELIQKEWHFFWPLRMGRAYQLLGQVYDKKNNIEKAYSSYLLATNYFQQAGSACIEEHRNTLIDISGLSISLHDAENMLFYSKKAIELSQAESLRNNDAARAWNNYGAACDLKGWPEKALEAYDSAMAIYQINPEINNFSVISIYYHNKAHSYLAAGQADKALLYIDTAITRNSTQQNLPEDRYRLASNHTTKGDILQAKRSYEDAITCYEKAIMLYSNGTTFTDSSVKDINVAVISNQYKNDLLDAIRAKGQTLLHTEKKNEALAYYDAAISLANKCRLLFGDESSKMKLAALTKKIFEGAIEVCLALSKEEEAFRYAEQSKSSVLLESVLQLKAMARLPDIDPALQKAWNDARTEISRLNKELNEYEISSPEYTELRKKIKTQEDELGQIEQRLQKIEAYVKLTTALNPPDISVIQNNLLEENQALVEYFIGEKQSYLFYIPKSGKLQTYRLNIDRRTLAQKTDSLLFAIRLPHADTSSIKDEGIRSFFEAPDMEERCDRLYAKYASELYDTLLAVARPPYVDLPERLIIIPDDVLGYLPFDALLTSKPAVGTGKPDYGSYPYLWKSPCHISYCYSGALLKEMRDNDLREDGNEMLAFAHPQRGFKKQLQDLKKLFKAPWSLFAGSFKVIKTKDQLKESVQNARYLHFSTHGYVDDRNPNYSYLDMREEGESSEDNNRLYLFDIYNLKAQNTAMVVTSACETGFGRLNRGEGIISLARGFSSAGASSIITTLWSVYQTESGELFNIFYENLQDGKTTKDEALSKAKASFIENNEFAKAPYYWAGIVPVGEMEPVSLPQKSEKKSLLLLGGLALALIIGLSLKKSFSKRKQ